MANAICSVENCTGSIRTNGLCYAHYMKNWRYGTPTPEFDPTWVDIRGQRFGTLVVIDRTGRHWNCRCDCGREVLRLAGCLNRAADGNTCGVKKAHWNYKPPKPHPDCRQCGVTFQRAKTRGGASPFCSAECRDDAAKERNKLRRPRAVKTCIVESCDQVVRTRRMCQKHYDAARYVPTAPRVKNTVCVVEGCERKPGLRRGYCDVHYKRLLTGKNLDDPIITRKSRAGNCEIEGCERPIDRRGHCVAHYGRLKTGRNLHDPIRIQEPLDRNAPCSVDGCERLRRVGKWCDAHYQRVKKGRDLTTPVRQVVLDRPAICSVDGCERRHSSHGYCATHLSRWKKHGSTEPRDQKSALTLAAEAGDFDTFTKILLKKVLVDENGCWVWPKVYKSRPYPAVMVAGEQLHRAVVQVKHGKKLGSQAVHHVCANASCVNPDHLQPVTHAENTAEMLARHSYLKRIAELEQALAELDPDHPILGFIKVA